MVLVHFCLYLLGGVAIVVHVDNLALRPEIKHAIFIFYVRIVHKTRCIQHAVTYLFFDSQSYMSFLFTFMFLYYASVVHNAIEKADIIAGFIHYLWKTTDRLLQAGM
nr:MAG TPA: hypothetical protein [Caudoviricetes sp.]